MQWCQWGRDVHLFRWEWCVLQIALLGGKNSHKAKSSPVVLRRLWMLYCMYMFIFSYPFVQVSESFPLPISFSLLWHSAKHPNFYRCTLLSIFFDVITLLIHKRQRDTCLSSSNSFISSCGGVWNSWCSDQHYKIPLLRVAQWLMAQWP